MNKNIIIAIIAVLVISGGGIYYYANMNSQTAVKTASDGHTEHIDTGEKKQNESKPHTDATPHN